MRHLWWPLDQSRRYIEDFDQTVTKSSTPREVIDAMLAKYPTWPTIQTRGMC